MIIIDRKGDGKFEIEFHSEEYLELKRLAAKYEYTIEFTLFYVIEYGLKKLSDHPYQ